MKRFLNLVCEWTIIFIVVWLIGCNEITVGQRSRAINFTYAGYGDSIYTVLYGKVLEIKKTGNINDTIPISGASIEAEQNKKTVKTDAKGAFSIALEKGRFNLIITKQGYQTLMMNNYISDPDRVSFTTVILIRGAGINNFEIPAPHR